MFNFVYGTTSETVAFTLNDGQCEKSALLNHHH